MTKEQNKEEVERLTNLSMGLGDFLYKNNVNQQDAIYISYALICSILEENNLGKKEIIKHFTYYINLLSSDLVKD